MKEEFIVTLKRHYVLGYMFQPFLGYKVPDKEYWEISNSITAADAQGMELPGRYKEIVAATEKYSESEIFKLFARKEKSKRNSVQEFLAGLSPNFVRDNIRPYIERHISKVLALLKQTTVPIFLKERSYNILYESDRLALHPDDAETVFNFFRTDQGIRYFLSLWHNGVEKKLTEKYAVVIGNEPAVLLLDNDIFTFQDINGKKLGPFIQKEYIQVPKNLEEKYFNTFIYNAVQHYRVSAEGFEIEEHRPTPGVRLLLTKDIEGTPALLLQWDYPRHRILPNHNKDSLVKLYKDNGYMFRKYLRNKGYEQTITGFLQALGLHFFFENYLKRSRSNDLYSLVNWLGEHKAKLDEKGITVVQEEEKTHYHIGGVKLRAHVKKTKTDWLDIYATVTIGEYTFPFVHFRKHILLGIREFSLPNGTIALLPKEWFYKYHEVFIHADVMDGFLRLRKHHFILLQDNPEIEGWDKQGQLKKLYEQTINKDVAPPQGLRADLRRYQIEGFAWMYHLHQAHFGGCLADDMGLGKTLQAITLLLKTQTTATATIDTNNKVSPHTQLNIFDFPANGHKTSLIVMPTSLLHNWENEFRKFAPQMRIMRYTGDRTGKHREFGRYDVILTSYGIVRNDIAMLENFQFFYIMIDESQYIKNPASKIYKAIMRLQAQHRMVLTGTPIENSLTDLWAQLNFLNQGLLGTYNYFKESFANPIERNKDPEREELLQALIHPFLLRRRKDEVALDLPPLSEQVYYCEMTEAQEKIYEAYKSYARNTILEDMEGDDLDLKGKSMLILETLMRLRQMANHPVLAEEGYKDGSGKFNEVCRALDNLVAEGHKVIIFSAFRKHLDLVAQYLESQDYGYAMLTGATQNRSKEIDRFQKEPGTKAFLITLKAGGTGLNITAADYVFILDPWWNPAAEDQAIGRAHRIGQDKKVFVYRFISRRTIEEKIHTLQHKKADLAKTFIHENDPFQIMDKAQLLEIFQ